MKKLFPALLMIMCNAMNIMAQTDHVIIPKSIHEGSKIAIITPASSVKDAVVDTAVVKLRERGYEPVVYPHVYGHAFGTHPASDEDRAADLMNAFSDPEIDAILCTRGGYGTVRMLPMLNADVIRNNPKWLIGYSDISDLHAFMHKAGVASIHGPMCGHIAKEADTIPSTEYLFKVLTDSLPLTYELPANDYNKPGRARGRLVGGNLLTINGLSETPYDIMNIGDEEDVILFIEDVSEQIYAIERVLMRMHYSGLLSKVKGFIVGQFTDYRKSDDFDSMEEMIYYWLKKWGYYNEQNPMPIVFDFPTGHVTENYPMIVSADTELNVTPYGTTLTFR